MSSTRRDFLGGVTQAGIGLAASSQVLCATAAATAATPPPPPPFPTNSLLFPFGQPVGGICQMSFVVEDIHRAIEKFTRRMRAGPWFLKEKFQSNYLYRGKPFEFHGSLANGNAGHMQIELIQQSDATPSPFTEVIHKRGYGLHHQALIVKDFQAQFDAFMALGYEVVLDFRQPGDGNVYLDTNGDFPFFIELNEATDRIVKAFTRAYQASVGWDGKDPLRDFDLLMA